MLAMGVTDEIFAVSAAKKGSICVEYFAGLMFLPYVGWAIGTFLGGVAMGILPTVLQAALGVALYGMFIAIIIPPAREVRAVALVVVAAAIMSCLLSFIPNLSSGWSIILCSVTISVAAAFLFPIREEEDDE